MRIPAADETLVTTLAPDVVSPELALIDSELAARARLDLVGPGDTLARPGTKKLQARAPAIRRDPESAAAPSANEAAAALRRLVEVELVSPEYEARERRIRRPLLVATFALAVAALVATLAFREQASLRHPTGSRPRSEVGASMPAATDGTASVAGGAAGSSAATRTEGVSSGSGAHAKSGSTAPTASASAGEAAAAERRASSSRPAAAHLRWPPAQGATGYAIELYRGDLRIFVGHSSTNRITVPGEWTVGGRKLRRDPGDRVYVWPEIAGRRERAPLWGRLVRFLQK
jgi:hypothetical protein